MFVFTVTARHDINPTTTSSKPAPAPTNSNSSTQLGGQQQQPEKELDNILLKALASESDDEEDSSRSTGAAGWAATLGVVAGISILMGGGYLFRGQIKHFLDFFIQAVDDWGVWGYLAYAAVYAGLEVLAVPAIPLTMTAGAIFGPLPGTVIVSISATFAATIAFLIARYAARDKVGDMLGGVGKGEGGFGTGPQLVPLAISLRVAVGLLQPVQCCLNGSWAGVAMDCRFSSWGCLLSECVHALVHANTCRVAHPLHAGCQTQ